MTDDERHRIMHFMDEAAMRAPVQLLYGQMSPNGPHEQFSDYADTVELMAKIAYRWASALLKARQDYADAIEKEQP